MDTLLPPLPLPQANGIHSLPPPTVDSTLPPLPLPLPLPTPTPKAAHSDQHERELPIVSTDLVPLSYVIDRMITQSYSDLSTLLETLPSHSDQQRKQLLVDYVLHTRRQFIKLLVLTRWSAESERIRKSMNIIGFLSNQNHQLEGTIHGLTETVSGLKGARVRNYDIETSLQVLQKGSYQGLPSAVREAFEGQEKLNDDEVIDTMRECEEVMRWRIKMGKEDVPKIMLNDYRIADGRVTFRLEGLWEASFVYSGTETQDPPTPSTSEEEEPAALIAEDQSEWYLLSIKFLFKVKDQRGGNWNPTPTGPLKQHLLDLCNAQLARRPFLPPPPAPRPPPQPQPTSSEGEPSIDPTLSQEHEELTASDLAQHSLDVKEARSKRRRDKPLQRAYTFLQRLALSYQLESVYSQAVQLIRSDWNACGLKVEISKERDRVRVGYWNSSDIEDRNKSTTNPKPQTPATSSSPSSSGPGGSLVFSMYPPASTSSTDPPPATLPSNPSSSSSRLNSRRKALDSLLSRSQSSSSEPPPNYPPMTLHLSYEPPSLSSSTLPQDIGQSELPSDLSLEGLLEKVTRDHARRSIEVLETELRGGGVEGARLIREEKNRKGKGKEKAMDLDPNEGVEEEDEAEEEEEGVPYLLIPLVGTRAISAHIDSKSGKFELRVANAFESAIEETAEAITDKSGEGGGEGEGASQESRLRSASDRINSLRFGATNRGGNSVGEGDYWMKSLPEVIAKIKATTILDEISTLLTLLSLPSLRRLPLPPRELSKFGPLPSFSLGRPTFLFVPLNAHSKNEGLEGFYLAIVLMEDGVRMGLLGTRECIEESTGNSWVEINDVGWIYDENLREGEEKGKEKASEVEMGEVQDRGSNFGFSLGTESLRKVWNYCVRRVLLYRLEQQLHSRQIAYRSSSASSRLSIGTKPPPFLILDTKGLVRLPGSTVVGRKGGGSKEEEGTVLRNAALQCEFDAEAGTIRTTLHIRLNPSIPVASLPLAFSPNPLTSTDTTPLSTLPRNVFYNPSRRNLVFLTENEVLGSAERLLRAYAGVFKELEEEIHRRQGETAKAKFELGS